MPYHAHGFVDGGYVRKLSTDNNLPLANPRNLLEVIVRSPIIQNWCTTPDAYKNVVLARVIYYDARSDETSEVDKKILKYWDTIELLEDTELGFGTMRGGTKRKPPRQKGVDTLLTVDMLVGAFTKIFDIAILVAGDADFVPVVNEVKRRGIMVAVAAAEGSISEDLKRAADRFVLIEPEPSSKSAKFPPLHIDGKPVILGDDA